MRQPTPALGPAATPRWSRCGIGSPCVSRPQLSDPLRRVRVWPERASPVPRQPTPALGPAATGSRNVRVARGLMASADPSSRTRCDTAASGAKSGPPRASADPSSRTRCDSRTRGRRALSGVRRQPTPALGPAATPRRTSSSARTRLASADPSSRTRCDPQWPPRVRWRVTRQPTPALGPAATCTCCRTVKRIASVSRPQLSDPLRLLAEGDSHPVTEPRQPTPALGPAATGF